MYYVHMFLTIMLFLVTDKLKSLSSTSLSLFFIVCVAAIVHMSCSTPLVISIPVDWKVSYSTTSKCNEVDVAGNFNDVLVMENASRSQISATLSISSPFTFVIFVINIDIRLGVSTAVLLDWTDQ